MSGLPISNAEFLAAVFGPLPPYQTPWVCFFSGRPELGNWAGAPWTLGTAAEAPDLNGYFTLATFRRSADGSLRRDNAHFAALHGLMLDDVGTKGRSLAELRAALPPSVLIETSPGNSQALYLFDRPLTDASRASALIDAAARAGWCDPAAKSPTTRYGRLPFGLNGKHSPPFLCQLTDWVPWLRYPPEAIAQCLGLDLAPADARTLAPAARSSVAPADWGALTALTQRRTIDDLRSALGAIPADDRGTWVSIGHALRRGLPDAVGFDLWADWSRKSPKCQDGDLGLWDTFRPDHTDYRAVFAAAQRLGWANPSRSDLVDLSSVGFGVGVTLPAGASIVKPDAMPTMRNSVGIVAVQLGVGLHNVRAAVRELGLLIAHDEFTGRQTIRDRSAPDGMKPRPLRDVDLIRIRERIGISKAVKAETMRDVAALEADAHCFDSGIAWGVGLTWDGVPRIEQFFARYLGAADTPYAHALGIYLWTGLGGRLMEPGVKADMVVILVGEQGSRKSSAIKALAINPEHFAELDLAKQDDDLARQMVGKTVIELPELRGMSNADVQALKAFVARTADEWIPKFMEQPVIRKRRCILIGTTNEAEFLRDATGERRWLPIRVATADTAAIERDLEQLWAEGIHRFRANGVGWQDAQRLAAAEHGQFKVSDDWADQLAPYLERNKDRPLKLPEIFTGGLQRFPGSQSRQDEHRLTAVLRAAGWAKKDCRHVPGFVGSKGWVFCGQ